MADLPGGCCDLIYVDPPFNSNKRCVSRQRDEWSFEDRHGKGVEGYLAFLAPRLARMHDLLSPRGSIYVHVDWRASHHVRLLLDQVFGAGNFLNEIIWRYRSGGRAGPWFGRKHDTIFAYARKLGRHTFNRLRGEPYRTLGMKHDEDGRPFKSTKNGPLYFHPDGAALSDVWDIPFLSTVSQERTRYPTQKPEALLERIVLAASDPGDVVADFFCGSGTTLAVAARLGRDWIGCDHNPEAVEMTKRRLSAAVEADA